MVIVPEKNLLEGCAIRNVKVFGAQNLNQVIHFLMERGYGEIGLME